MDFRDLYFKHYFKISNKNSNKNVEAIPGSTWEYMKQNSERDDDLQRFLMIPMGDGAFLIANKSNGRVLGVKSGEGSGLLGVGATSSGDDGAWIVNESLQHEPDGSIKARQLFYIEYVGDFGTTHRYYTIRSKASNLVWEVDGSRKDDGALLRQRTYDSSLPANRLFRFFASTQTPKNLNPDREQLGIVSTFSTPLPKLERNQDGIIEEPKNTEPCLIERSRLLCYSVKDPKYPNITQRMIESSYYVLEKRVYYKLIVNRVNQTSATESGSVDYERGWSEAEAKEFTSTTGIEVGASLGEVSASLKQEFSFSSSTESLKSRNEKFTHEYTVKSGRRFVAWQPKTQLTLKRADGSHVKSWIVEGADEAEALVTDDMELHQGSTSSAPPPNNFYIYRDREVSISDDYPGTSVATITDVEEPKQGGPEVSIDAALHDSKNPKTVHFKVGIYRATVKPGSGWTGYGSVRGCDSNGSNCERGWHTEFFAKSEIQGGGYGAAKRTVMYADLRKAAYYAKGLIFQVRKEGDFQFYVGKKTDYGPGKVDLFFTKVDDSVAYKYQ